MPLHQKRRLVELASDYKDSYARRDVRVDKKLVKLAIPKIRIKLRAQDEIEKEFKWIKMETKETMRAPLLDTTVYGWYFTVDGDYLGAVDSYAMQYIDDHQGFIGDIIKRIWKSR